MKDVGVKLQVVASCREFQGVIVAWTPDEWLMLPPQAWALFADLVRWADDALSHWLTWLEQGYGPGDEYDLMFEEALAGHRTWLPLADSGLIRDIMRDEAEQIPEWSTMFRGEVAHFLGGPKISVQMEGLACKLRVAFSLPADRWPDLVAAVQDTRARVGEIEKIIGRWSDEPVGATLHEDLAGADEELAGILPLLQRADLRTKHSCAGHIGLVRAPSGVPDGAVVPTNSYLSLRVAADGVPHIERLVSELRQTLPGCEVRYDGRGSDGEEANEMTVTVAYLPRFHPHEFIETEDPEWFKEQQKTFLQILADWAESLPPAESRLF